MKSKIIDTNVIMDHGLEDVIEQYSSKEEKTNLLIPFGVIIELDSLKRNKYKSEKAKFNIRQSIRVIEVLRNKASIQNKNLTKSFKAKGNCYIKVVLMNNEEGTIEDLDKDYVDNQIIEIASKTIGKEDCEIITGDLHERIIADILGIKSNEYKSDNSLIYKGLRTINITDEQVQELNKNYHERKLKTEEKYHHNEFIEMIDSSNNKYYGIYKDGEIEALKENYDLWSIRAKTKDGQAPYQKMLAHALMDESIKLVSCIGPAGAGKTCISLAHGLENVMKEHGNKYDKIIFITPMIEAGQNLGALPGNKIEKLRPWVGSAIDNIKYLLNSDISGNSYHKTSPNLVIKNLIEEDKLEFEAMAYLRGRSIPNQYIVVDDAQNLSPKQIKTIITRIGEGSKVVLLGDIDEKQIDSKYLSSLNNGLTYAVNKLKGASNEIAHIYFENASTFRSHVASIAVDLL